MLAFIVRRLLISIPVLLVSTIVVFGLTAGAGSPLDEFRLRNPPPSEEAVAAYEERLNLDKTIPERYVIWLSDLVLEQDLGTDNRGREVTPLVTDAVGQTLRLVIASVFIAVTLAVAVGVVSAVRQYSWFDYASTFFTFLFFSLPVFWLGVLLKQFVALPVNDFLETLGLDRFLGTVQAERPGLQGSFWDKLPNRIGHLILPATTLIIISFAQYTRFTRASMLDVLKSDYVRTAESKGITRRRVLTRHALRNALIPVTTIVAIDFGAVIGGAVVTETVFQWRGMGTLFTDAVRFLDVNIVLGCLLLTATMVIVFNLVADILYSYLDPRIRL